MAVCAVVVDVFDNKEVAQAVNLTKVQKSIRITKVVIERTAVAVGLAALDVKEVIINEKVPVKRVVYEKSLRLISLLNLVKDVYDVLCCFKKVVLGNVLYKINEAFVENIHMDKIVFVT